MWQFYKVHKENLYLAWKPKIRAFKQAILHIAASGQSKEVEA